VKFDILEILKQFSGFIPVVVAFIYHIFFQKRIKFKRFYQQAENNISNACGPMYFKLEKIFRIEDEMKREKQLDLYFNDYGSSNFPIHQLSNLFVIEWFLKVEEYYEIFKQSRTDADWEKFWEELDYLKIMLEDEYWANFSSVYSEYLWFRKNIGKSFWTNFLFETLRITKQLSNLLVAGGFFAVYFTVYDFFFLKWLPEGSILISILVLLLFIAFYGCMLALTAPIASSFSQKKNLKAKFIKKKWPSLWKFYEEKMLKSPNKNIKIPKKHERP